ncbi:MAG: hypothetical protein ACJ762_01880 [Solirubrobacteraceae bacterium]
MDPCARLGDTVVLDGHDLHTLVERVEAELGRGERLLCVDASDLEAPLAGLLVSVIAPSARLTARCGGHLTVLCSLPEARGQLAALGVAVLSDRTIARAVLA